jgi:Tol biopolymer transport system component
MRPNGDSLVQLGQLYGAIRPAWSRDGSHIAFVPREAGSGIWLYDLNSGTASQLLAYGNYPSWHPGTGEIIALDVQIDLSSGVALYSFLAVTPSTRAVRTISSFTTISDCGFSSISPDGNTIVYSLRRPDDHVQIWSFDINLVQHKQLTSDGGDFAAWSPDGKKIVYTRTQPGDGTLWVMNADGSNKRRLTKP